MKTSEIAIETIKGLENLKSILLNADNVDKDYLEEIEFYSRQIKKSVFNHMVKYEYPDFYLRSRSKKISPQKFIDNPEKTLELFRNPKAHNLKKK